MEPFERELQVAKALAVAAGKLAVVERDAGLRVEMKGKDDPVTQADKAASELILAGLAQAFPGDVLISEEAPDQPARLQPGARVWYVDPIDGTQDFIYGFPGFGAMIGLVADGRPLVGAVYQPTTDRLFWAAEGQGAWVTDATGTRRIHVSTVTELNRLRIVVSQSHPSKRVARLKQDFGITDELKMGSIGIKVGLIALGERDLYFSASTKANVWDTCAPEIILQEAGGRLTNAYGRPLRYDALDVRHPEGLLATNGVVHDEVVRRLRKLLPPTLEQQPRR